MPEHNNSNKCNSNNRYKVFDLVTDFPNLVTNIDPNLQNAWGIARLEESLYVCSNSKGFIMHYDLDGRIKGPSITVPAANGSGTGSPTGLVLNPTNGYVIANPDDPTDMVSSLLIACTEDGLIVGFEPMLNTNKASIAYNGNSSSQSPPVYKGIALGKYLYAADFHNNMIDVFDYNFKKVNPTKLAPNAFTDATIPSGFAPFNITVIKDLVFVSYAKQMQPGSKDDVPGPGNGFINVFDQDGLLVRRLVSQDLLNSPWAMVIAPDDFGVFQNELLVGNFGDGTVNVYQIYGEHIGQHIGVLRDRCGIPIRIPGLWGIARYHRVVFAASGPSDEQHGLVSKIKT
jgi:uncharacterized protein (TIGR03118 family)